MASFTDRTPISYTPYISQQPVNAMVQIGMDREQKYWMGVDRVQNQINTVSQLTNSLLRPEAKEYLNSKLNNLVADINTAGGQDFSQTNVYSQLMAKTNAVGQDQALNTELQNSLKISNKMAQIQALKEKDPKLYSQYNEEYAMEDANKWLMSGAPVGSSFNDTKPFSPYYDYNEEMRQSIKDYLSNQDVQQVIDPNTGLVTQTKGKTPQQMKEYLMSTLSEKAKQQMRIEGHVMGNRMSDQSIMEMYNSGLDDQIRDEKLRNDTLQQAFHSPASKMTDSEKLNYEYQIKNSNQSLAQLQAARTDRGRLQQVLANKGDFYGEVFMNGTIGRLAYSAAPMSVTYDSNSAIVAQLNHQFEYKMEAYRQGQINEREKNSNAIQIARLNQEGYYKDIELGIRRDLADNTLANGQYTRSGRYAGGINGNTPLGQSPNETILPVANTKTLTREETGTKGYERFTGETDGLYQTYGTAKYSIINDLMSDPLTRREIASAMGTTSDNALSMYVAAPQNENFNSYTNFMMMDPTILNAADNYLTAKNNQWLKGEKVSPKLDAFFNATKDLKVNLDARNNYDKVQKEKLKSNLTGAGVSPLTVDGKVISMDDIIEYATTGKNSKIETIPEKIAANNGKPLGFWDRYGGGSAGPGSPGRDVTVTSNPSYQAVMDMVGRAKSSQSFVEYKNAFNESFGQEGMLSSFNYDLSNKKNQRAIDEFNSYAAQITNLWNNGRGVRQLSIDEIKPSFTVDRATGEVNFSYEYKDDKGKTISVNNNKIVVPSLKSSLIDSDKNYAQMLFYGQGQTPLIPIRGSKPFNVSVVSTSTDPRSQYTVNSDNSPAKFYLRDESGQIIDDNIGGFNSPTEAVNWAEDISNRVVTNASMDWLRTINSNPDLNARFKAMSEDDQGKALDQYISGLDINNKIQTLSSNKTLNNLRQLKAALEQEQQQRGPRR